MNSRFTKGPDLEITMCPKCANERLGPLPVTAVTTVTMFQTPPPPSKKPSRSSRLGRFQRQADTSPGVAPAVLIADVVVCQQLPGPDV